jgi:type VI secretion system protein ImpG
VALDGTRSEWRLVPDARRPAAMEVVTVESVRFSRPDAPAPRKVPHFQHLKHEENVDALGTAEGMSWLASRRLAPGILGGTETFLALRDPQFNPSAPADGVLSVETLCCNRDLPSLLLFGDGQPFMRIGKAEAPVAGVVCLSAPTATLRPPLRERSGWRLVSHLALNHLAVTGSEDAARALREMLRLHDLRQTQETALALDGLLAAEARTGLARLPGVRPGSYARGLDVTLSFEPQAWAAGGLYLLGAVLERYLALEVSVNGFVRTHIALRGRSAPVASWPARSGTQVLL